MKFCKDLRTNCDSRLVLTLRSEIEIPYQKVRSVIQRRKIENWKKNHDPKRVIKVCQWKDWTGSQFLLHTILLFAILLLAKFLELSIPWFSRHKSWFLRFFSLDLKSELTLRQNHFVSLSFINFFFFLAFCLHLLLSLP